MAKGRTTGATGRGRNTEPATTTRRRATAAIPQGPTALLRSFFQDLMNEAGQSNTLSAQTIGARTRTFNRLTKTLDEQVTGLEQRVQQTMASSGTETSMNGEMQGSPAMLAGEVETTQGQGWQGPAGGYAPTGTPAMAAETATANSGEAWGGTGQGVPETTAAAAPTRTRGRRGSTAAE
jgi:hypothetical protein